MGAIESFLKKITDAIHPDRNVGIAEWAEDNRVLPPDSPEPGKWRNSRTPYLVGIMDALSGLPSKVTRYAHDDTRIFDNSRVTLVAMQKGHQLGGSALGENFIGRAITQAAGNILAVFATRDDAEKWEMDRFESMRTSTKALKRLIRDSNKKGSENTKLRKKFAGGMLNLVSAMRAGRLKSTTVRYALLEEVDEWQFNVDGQGNPVMLTINRTSNFGRRAKVFANSTPTIKRRSQIEALYEQGDQRRYFVHCPECSAPQFFDWHKGMKRSPSDPSTVLYFCQTGCGVGSTESAWKTKGYENAYWMPTARGAGKVASFHLSALYAPLGWRPWSELMDDFEAAKTDTLKMIAFVNNALAECWEDKSAELKWEAIKRRAEPYKLRSIPIGALILVCSVDTQNDRLEVQTDAYGRGMRNWTIDYVVFHGDPARPEVWNQLDAYLERTFTNAFGVSMRIQLCGVDSGGGRTQDVYDYCRTRRHKGVFALKGASEKHKPIIGKPTDVDVTVKGKTYAKGVKLWPVGTDTAKSRIFGDLLGDEELEPVDRRMHFSIDLEDEYYEQLTAEAYNPSKDRWDKLRKRNEALDLKVYSLACAYHPRLRLNTYTDADWAALEAVIEPRINDLFSAPVGESAAAQDTSSTSADPDDDVATVVVEASETSPTVPAAVESPPQSQPATDSGVQGQWIPKRKNWFGGR
ncbi:phage terminase large subunit family protein [Burkholderia sp. Bp9142]|uniref:phage terminase large subunit family protein n=1 Tax=Burkholderia sp. Bp9142 TaxID=2184573 RepID=UPI000F5A61E0|nr:terminase gpA endonuclease subunit [Burkholderia sp. Bp9142]RQR38020.1 phage terminase large subunit family protein [Burkholderia sp. Bp9142]